VSLPRVRPSMGAFFLWKDEYSTTLGSCYGLSNAEMVQVVAPRN